MLLNGDDVNRDLLEAFLAERLPMFSLSHVEATYLAWLDTRWLGLRNTAAFFETAGVKLSDGTDFRGRGYMRLNFGCPRVILERALERIHSAFRQHRLIAHSGFQPEVIHVDTTTSDRGNPVLHPVPGP